VLVTIPGTKLVKGGLYQIVDLEELAAHFRPIIEANKAEQTKDGDAAEMSGEGWRGTMTCGACPVQIEGEVDGHAFYFRARGGGWSFGISHDPMTDAYRAKQVDHSDRADPRIQAIGLDGDTAFEADGDDPAHGWMPYAEAWRNVQESIAAWRKQKEQQP
jgi:hypothetical protein